MCCFYDPTALTSNTERRATFPSSKQRNLPIFVPLWQSICWSHVSALRRSESNKTSQNRLPFLPLHTCVKAFPALVRTPVPDNFTNPQSVNIFLTTPNVPYITIRTNYLSLLELALHFISPPWKRLSSNLWILFSETKRIRLLLEDVLNLLNFPLVDCSNDSTKSKLHLQPMTTRLFLSPKPFVIGHCFNQWDLFFSVYKPVR